MLTKKTTINLLKIGLFLTFLFWLIRFAIVEKSTLNLLRSGFQNEIDSEYKGVIVKKFYDHDNHNSPKIIFADGSGTGINGKFWGQMEEGDSISKIKGDSIIQVFKGGKRIEIEIAPFYQKAIQKEIEKKNKR